MNNHPRTRHADLDDTVIDLAARRRCHLERAGYDPITVALGFLAETGTVPNWDTSAYYDDDPDSGWAA